MSSALENYVLAFAGKLTVKQAAAEETAQKLSAKVFKKLDDSFEKQKQSLEKSHTFCLIIGSEVDQTSKKFEYAKDNGFIMLKETWLNACDEKQAALPTDKYLWSSEINPPEANEEPGGSRVKPSKNVIPDEGEYPIVATEEHVGEEHGGGSDNSRGEVGQSDKEQRSQGRNEDTAVPDHEFTESTEPPSAHPVLGSEAASNKGNPKASGHSKLKNVADADVRERNDEHEQHNINSEVGQRDNGQNSQGKTKDTAVPGHEFTKTAEPPSSDPVLGSEADSNKRNPKASDHSKDRNGGPRLKGYYLGTSHPAQMEPGWNTIEIPEDPDSPSATVGNPVKGQILCRIHYYFLVLLPGKEKDLHWNRGVLVLASQYGKEAGRFERNGGKTLYPKSADFLSNVNRCTDMVTYVVASNAQKTRSYIIAAKPKSRDLQAFTKTTYNARWGNKCGDHTINAARKMAGQKLLKRVQKLREERIPGRYLRAMGGKGFDSEDDLNFEDD